MTTEMVFLCAFFTSIPICLRYFLAFRARSLNRKILERQERTDEKREPKFTVTAEFALHTNSRSATRREGSLPAG